MDVPFITFFHILLVPFSSIVYMVLMFCMLLYNSVNYVSLLLCICILTMYSTYRSGYSVSLCRSVRCLCINVHCATATGCQPNCS